MSEQLFYLQDSRSYVGNDVLWWAKDGIERERQYFDVACRRIEQAYAQPRLFDDAKVGAGDTAVQGDMLLPANAKVSGGGAFPPSA